MHFILYASFIFCRNHNYDFVLFIVSSSSWDEHLFEIVLPKATAVGHVDIKFSLHPHCTNCPNVQITLLKQSMGNFGRQGSQTQASIAEGGTPMEIADAETNEAPSPAKRLNSGPRTQVDTKVQFNIDGAGAAAASSMDDDKKAEHSKKSRTEPKASGSIPTKLSGLENPVTNPEFLERHGAEIVCGPVELTGCVDMSGHSGIVTLSSPQLLKVKSRSFLIHFKASGKDKPGNNKSAHQVYYSPKSVFKPPLAPCVPCTPGTKIQIPQCTNF